MKSRFSLASILGSAIFLSHLAASDAVADEPTYLRWFSDEKLISFSEFTILSLKAGSLDEIEGSNLANSILSENADVICIQEIIAEDQANDFHEVLKEQYAHFVYMPHTENLACGMLIASRFYIDEPQFTMEEGPAGSNCTLQGQLPDNSLTNIELKPTICATPIPLPGNCMGVRTFVKLANSQVSRGLTAQRLVLIPIVSRRGGNDSGGGGASVQGEATIGFGPGGTTFDVNITAEAHDGKGNYVAGKGEYNVNSGEGSVSVRGGTISEKD